MNVELPTRCICNEKVTGFNFSSLDREESKVAEEPRSDLDLAELQQEHEDDLPGLVIAEEPEDAEVSEPPADEEGAGPLTQSSLVGFWGVSCGGGAWSSFVVPITTYPYVARFVFVNAAGARKYSGFAYHNRSEYPGSKIWAHYPYALPRWSGGGGTKHVYAYWWCGTPGDPDTRPPYWNYVNTNC